MIEKDLDIESLRRRTGEKWKSYPEDVLPVWVADMDFPLAEPLQELLRHTLEHSDTGYPMSVTRDGLPRIFAERAAECWGWQVSPNRIELITDVVQGLYVALHVLTEPGEAAVIQTPIYPPFLSCVEQVGRRMIVNELRRGDARYEIDFDALRAAIDDGTRMLMLCNPHNPTGRVFTRVELEGLAEVALERDQIIVSDEIHADLVLTGREHLPIASLGPEVEARTITLTSATKAFNIAGLRCALAAFGSADLQRGFNALPRYIRGGLGSLGLAATEIAWTRCQDWLDEVIATLEENRSLVTELVSRLLPGVRHLPSEGTYLAWLDCRDLELPDGPYRFFLEHGRVALSDGARFGPGGDGFVRLNFATSREIVTEAVERMAKAIQTHAA